MYSITPESAVCAALTAASGALLLWRPEVRRARALWVAIGLMGLTHGLALNLPRPNLLSTNLVHYYLGAKYPIPYARFYEVFQAAQEQPAIGIRDLEHPDRLLRAEAPARRAYYIDLLRRSGAAFDAMAPVDSLAAWSQRTGALARESDRVLRRFLSARQIADYREDVRVAVENARGRPLTDDFGFNGSPFYALVRHLDPTLYLRLGPVVGWANHAWQILAVILLAWIAGEALGLDLDGRLVACELLFASYDFTAYALPGLMFGELWLPVGVAVLAIR